MFGLRFSITSVYGKSGMTDEVRQGNRHSSLQESKSTGNSGDKNNKEAFEWTLRMSSLLSQLLDVISKEIKAWEAFISDDGDCGYFSDIWSFTELYRTNHQGTAYASLCSINNLFKTLESYRQTLVALEKSYDKTARDVSQSYSFPFLSQLPPSRRKSC